MIKNCLGANKTNSPSTVPKSQKFVLTLKQIAVFSVFLMHLAVPNTNLLRVINKNASEKISRINFHFLLFSVLRKHPINALNSN